jgi:hypothetical protein
MDTITLHGSEYYPGPDGVRRLYGPGLFDINEAGQIVGPHTPEQPPAGLTDDDIIDEIPPSQGGGKPADNGG